MTESKRPNASSRNAWTGFLPAQAIIMARKEVPTAQATQAVSSPLTPVATEISAENPLAAIASQIQTCALCKLSQGRTQVVPGEGSPEARLMFVGEGPGEQEDLEGRPFVGKAGQLLDRMIEAMGLRREDVFIANVVKCRPPGNRNPEPDEIAACSSYLERQIEAVKPQVIVALGKFAAQTLLKTETRISELRGHFHPFTCSGRAIRLMPTFHPAYLLRNPSSKKEAWADLQLVAAELGIKIPSKNS